MKYSSVISCLAFVSISSVSALGPKAGQIKNLFTFGDSYTDVVNVGDDSVAWPVYAAGYGNFNLFPFARAGATCSNNLTFRAYPSVFESQLPLFFEDMDNGTLNEPKKNEQETIYTLWIGTNDLGISELITGDQTPGVTVVDTTACAVNWVKALYGNGARNFLFQNMIPLERTILYSANTYPNRYWSAPHNGTDWSLLMSEMTNAGNTIAKLMLESLALALPASAGGRSNLNFSISAIRVRQLTTGLMSVLLFMIWSCQSPGLFDSHALFSDIIVNPADYLNGTAPLSVVDPINVCIYQVNDTTGIGANCSTASGTDRDSYL